MKIPPLRFTVTDWSAVAPTVHPGESGEAIWRTFTIGDLRVRQVEYTPGYLADHWCDLGHVLYVLEGELDKVQLAPANLHWCSDEALTRLADCSRKYGVPLHMHLLETAYQKEYARRRGGGTAVEYIDPFGLLGPQMTLGHGVWLNGRDIQRLAENGACVWHN